MGIVSLVHFRCFLITKMLSLDDNVGCRHRGQTHGNHTMSLNCGHHQPAMAAREGGLAPVSSLNSLSSKVSGVRQIIQGCETKGTGGTLCILKAFKLLSQQQSLELALRVCFAISICLCLDMLLHLFNSLTPHQ